MNSRREIRTDVGRIIVRKTRLVDDFLVEANKYSPLNAEEESRLIELAQKGDEDARNKVLCSNLKFLYSLSARFQDGENILDLIDEAYIGMDKALATFDATRGFRFISYAVFQMRFMISNYYKNFYRTVTLPKTVSRLGDKPQLAMDRLFQENGYMPSIEQIEEYIETYLNEKVIRATDLIPQRYKSLDKPLIADEGDSSSVAESGELAYIISNKDEYDDTQKHIDETFKILMQPLNEREKLIVNLWRKRGGHELVAHELGVTPEYVGMILHRAIAKMKKRTNHCMLKAV